MPRVSEVGISRCYEIVTATTAVKSVGLRLLGMVKLAPTPNVPSADV